MLEGLLAPLRVVLQRSLGDWLIVVATWLVIVCATTLLAIGVLYGDAVALSGLRQTLAAESITATSIDVQMRVEPDELATVDEVVSAQSRRILGWTDGELARMIRSGTFGLDGAVPDVSDTDLAIFAASDRLVEHAAIVEGHWPASGAEPLEVAISIGAAEALRRGVGDELSLTSRAGEDRVVELVIVGTWKPNDPAERYWLGDELELTGVSEGASFTVHGPLVVTGDDLVGRVATGDLDVSWRTLPEFDNLELENVGWMRSDAAALERRIRSELGERAFFSVETDLPQVLQGVDRSLLVSRSGVLLLTIQFAILAAYALVLVAGLLVEQRRIETALLRSRGGSAGHVAWMALLEGLVLVVPAALAAPWIALGVLRLFDAVGPLSAAGVNIEPRVDSVALLVAGIAGVACLIGLVVPAFASGRGLAAVRQTMARQGNRTFAQRLGIDLALVVLAGIGLWQLRQYGAPLTATVRGSIGLDPLLVAAPAIGLLAGAILALRIVPLLAELGERALGSRRGLVAPLGARQLSRRPLRYTRSALLLMLAAALGTFAAAYTATWTRSQTDQAAYQSGGDLRVEIASFPDLPLWAFGGAFEDVEGVERAMAVMVDAFDVASAGRDGQLLGLDTGALAEIVELRSDLLDGRSLGELAASLAPDLEGLEPISLPGEPTGLTIGLDTRLENLPAEDEDGNVLLPETLLVGQVGVAIRDAAGLVHIFDGTTQFQATAPGQRIAVPLTDEPVDGEAVLPNYPIELLGIQLTILPPPETVIAGELSVTSVGSVDMEILRDGWTWLIERGQLAAQPAPAAPDRPDAVSIPEAQPIVSDDGPVEVRLVPDSLADVADRPLPIAASRSFADQTRAEVGDPAAIGSLTRRTQVEIAAIIDAFPTLEPQDPFAIVDLGGLALVTYARSGDDLFADEWWLSVTDEAAAVAALNGAPYSVESLVSRTERTAELTDDPVALGVIGALAIGSIAALIVAIIGFVVSAVVSTRERLGEFALLRAMGMSPGQLSAWLTFENAFLLAAGIVAGSGLGLLLSWLVLPFVTLTAEARVVVPPVLVEIPWLAIGVVHLLAAVGLVVAVVVIGGILRRVPVSGVLRAGQD
ncbi:MAG: FtsX-like permease family protein [Chloroflexota bacterium]